MLFSVGADPRLYNEGPRITESSSETQKSACEEKTQRVY